MEAPGSKRRRTLGKQPALACAKLDDAWCNEFEQPRFADVVFDVEGTKFPLMRAQLAVASPAFAAMLMPQAGGCWKEHSGSEDVVIKDMEPQAFMQLAKYAYRLTVELTPETVMRIQKAADKYQISGLVKMCDEYIEALLEDIDADAALALLDGEVEATGSCDKFGSLVESLGVGVFKSSTFSTLHSQTVEWILNSSINAHEDEVWHACHKWATAAGTKSGAEWQDVLRPMAGSIRFPCMSSKLFDTAVAKTGLLPKEKVIDIMLHRGGEVLIRDFPGSRQIAFDPATAGPGTMLPQPDVVEFNTEAKKRCVFAKQGFDRGTASWTIEVLKVGVVGAVGIATQEEMQRGSKVGGAERFLQEACWGGFNWGGVNLRDSDRLAISLPTEAGVRLAITVDMDKQTITYQAKGRAPVKRDFAYRGILHPAVSAWGNCKFRIFRGAVL